MSTKTLEQRFDDMEKTVKRQQHEIERLQAVNECQNLMGKYQYWHTSNQHNKIVESFARKTPGVKIHCETLGNFEGPTAVDRVFGPNGAIGGHDKGTHFGMLMVHALTTCVIEVAADGKTAKAVWLSPGHETGAMGGGKPQANWSWGKYGVDFVKEDGKWKFWHWRLSPQFNCPFEKAWTDIPHTSAAFMLQRLPKEMQPDSPNNEFYGWSIENEPKNKPLPPEPYETFDEELAY